VSGRGARSRGTSSGRLPSGAFERFSDVWDRACSVHVAFFSSDKVHVMRRNIGATAAAITPQLPFPSRDMVASIRMPVRNAFQVGSALLSGFV